MGRVPVGRVGVTVARGEDDCDIPYLCTRKLMTDGPTRSLSSGTSTQIVESVITSDETRRTRNGRARSRAHQRL